jgi:hypothetical protein
LAVTGDINHDGRVDYDDVLAQNRRLDQQEQAAFWGGVFAALFAMWDWLRAFPGRAARTLRRVRIVASVHLVAESVTDAQALYDRLFPLPPVDPGHDSYRRSFVALALERQKTREQWLLFADMLDGLQAFDERPLDAWLLLRRAPKPQLTAPRGPVVESASLPPIQGFLATPVAALNPVTQVLAAALVITLLWGLWRNGEANKVGEVRARLEQEQSANLGLRNRAQDAENRATQTEATLKDYEQRVADMAKKDSRVSAELAAIRRRAKERANAVNSGSTAGRSDDEWVRGIAEPALYADPAVPAGPAAAPAAGVLGQVPGAPGSDAGPGDHPQQ